MSLVGGAGPLSVLYDGECPICALYRRHLRLRQVWGEISYVDIRGGGPLVDMVRARGFDLDQGMALVWGDEVFHGVDCAHQLALMSSSRGWFNRLYAAVFRRPRLARLVYPVVRLIRSALLRALGAPGLSRESGVEEEPEPEGLYSSKA